MMKKRIALIMLSITLVVVPLTILAIRVGHRGHGHGRRMGHGGWRGRRRGWGGFGGLGVHIGGPTRVVEVEKPVVIEKEVTHGGVLVQSLETCRARVDRQNVELLRLTRNNANLKAENANLKAENAELAKQATRCFQGNVKMKA